MSRFKLPPKHDDHGHNNNNKSEGDHGTHGEGYAANERTEKTRKERSEVSERAGAQRFSDRASAAHPLGCIAKQMILKFEAKFRPSWTNR